MDLRKTLTISNLSGKAKNITSTAAGNNRINASFLNNNFSATILQTLPTESDFKLNYVPKAQIKFTPSSLINHFSNNVEKKNKFDSNNLYLKYLEKNNGREEDTTKIAFKTSYMMKFAKNMDRYDKILKKFDCLSTNSKKLANDNYFKLKSLSETKDKTLFEKLSGMISINSGNSSSSAVTTLNTAEIKTNTEAWKDCVKLFYDYETYWLNIADILFKDLNFYYQSNIELHKKNSQLQSTNENNKKEIEYLNKFIENNDIDYKAMIREKGVKEIDTMKKQLEQKEKFNLINVYRLEEE